MTNHNKKRLTEELRIAGGSTVDRVEKVNGTWLTQTGQPKPFGMENTLEEWSEMWEELLWRSPTGCPQFTNCKILLRDSSNN